MSYYNFLKPKIKINRQGEKVDVWVRATDRKAADCPVAFLGPHTWHNP